jgi:polar amino acid transport system substrate-binding protein
MTNKIAAVALIVALIALGVALFRPAPMAGVQQAKKETTFERVMRTHTLRCGYAVWSPVLYKDMKTGKIRGIAPDIVEAMGKKLDLKIDWAEEATWGTLVEGLTTGRYDATCVVLAQLSARAKVIGFSAPVLFASEYMIVRNNDTRFKKNIDLNNPSYGLVVLEGEAAALVARQKYPQAAIRQMPQNIDYTLVFQEVETKKADAAIMELAAFKEYEKNNPGKLRILDRNDPVLVMQMGFGLPQGDVALKNIIDTAIGELMMDGTVEAAIRAHSPSPDAFFTPARPYQLPN